MLGKGKSKLGLLDAGEQTIKELCGQTLFVLPRLKDYILSEIEKNGQHDLFYNVEMPLVRVLANMEEQGFMVDKAQLAAFSKKLGAEISGLEKALRFGRGRI